MLCYLLLPILFSAATCTAADLRVEVSAPRGAMVAGARVEIYAVGSSKATAIRRTSAEGQAEINGLEPGEYRLEVVAPGFTPASRPFRVPTESPLKIELQVAGPSHIVVVSATRTLVPVDQGGSTVELLDDSQLENMRPFTISDALRFTPGAVVNQAGQRGGQASLFVRGGESRYNKVIIDGVPVNEPGGTFDFGVVPVTQVERMELARGAQSVLYGSDAMTSVVQTWSATGHTTVPEVRFGADGGTFGTARGYASIAGMRGRLDYNFFGQQDATDGQGPNDSYSSSSQGANVGVMLSHRAFLRVRARHANSRSGVQGQWVFEGEPLLNPDLDAYARQNNFLGSVELDMTGPGHWQHRFTGYEYSHRGKNADGGPNVTSDRGCDPSAFNFFDCFFSSPFEVNRAGFSYQAEYATREWARTTFGYEFEDENGSFHSRFLTADFITGAPVIGISDIRGLRRNHALFGQEFINRGRISARAGLRYVHNESFGDKLVPQFSVSAVARRGHTTLGTTRFTASFAQGIKEPRFEESFGISGTFPANPNPALLPEENRAFDAGVSQSFLNGRHALVATYFNNRFRQQIQFNFATNQYFNVAKSMAHGAELEWHSRVNAAVALTASYAYTSGQILSNPGGSDPYATGEPLLRRPRHFGSVLLNYSGRRWGGNLGGSFVGRRFDSDFLFGMVPPQDHTPGYARIDVGTWYALNRYATAYINVENALDRHYEEVSGYPALKANFRAGMRFRVGGE